MDGKLEQFFKQSEKLEFDSSQEVALDDPNICYFTERGKSEIYLIHKKKEKKYFIADILERNLIFGIEPNDDFALVARVENLTVLRKNNLKEIFKEESLIESFVPYFNNWIFALNDRLFPVKNRKIDQYIEDQRSYTSCKNKIMSFKVDPKEKSKVFWFSVKDGTFLLKNHLSLLYEPSDIFPVISKTWLKFIDDNISFGKEDLLVLLKENKALAFINSINRKIFYNFLYDFQDKMLKDDKRMFSRIVSEKNMLMKTKSLLLSLLWKRKEYSFTSNLPLIVQVFEIVANRQRISVKLPRFFTNISNNKHTINEIADSSSIRVKKIVLEKKWWKKDLGHFIGFKKGKGNPVAIIRQFNKYISFDPDTGNSERITKENYSSFLFDGFSLYKAFPDMKLSIKQIFSFALIDKKKEFFFQGALGVTMILLNSSIPFATGIVFNTIVPFLDQSLLVQLSFGLILMSISFGVFLLISGILTVHLQTWFQFILQTALWDKLLKMPISFFSNYSVGNLLRRSFSVTFIQNVFNNTFFIYIFAALFSLLYLIVMFHYSVGMTLIGILVVVFGSLILMLFYKRIIVNDTAKVEKSAEYNGFVLQVINGIEKIRLYALEKIIYSRWGEKYYSYSLKDIASKKLGVYASAWNDSLAIISTLIIFFSGLHYIKQGLSVSSFIAFNVAFGLFSISIYRGVNILGHSLGTIIPFWRQGKSILDAEEEVKTNLAEPEKLMGYIQVENVSFKYQDSDSFVLHDISVKIDPGEFIAIVGPSGCGKSTLLRLLFKFYEPFSGSIYFDGNDLSHLDPVKLRKQLGIVLQDSDILAGTIYDNLLIQEGITEEEIDNAMKLSGFDKVIAEMPMKYFTYLSEGGKNLSVGQKQQLLIARSLLRGPQILFLDEATNALDNKTQNQISLNIKNLKMTRVVIAHRLSTIRSADRIYVMKEGRIVESGTWDELVNLDAVFAGLLKKQKL